MISSCEGQTAREACFIERSEVKPPDDLNTSFEKDHMMPVGLIKGVMPDWAVIVEKKQNALYMTRCVFTTGG